MIVKFVLVLSKKFKFILFFQPDQLEKEESCSWMKQYWEKSILSIEMTRHLHKPRKDTIVLLLKDGQNQVSLHTKHYLS